MSVVGDGTEGVRNMTGEIVDGENQIHENIVSNDDKYVVTSKDKGGRPVLVEIKKDPKGGPGEVIDVRPKLKKDPEVPKPQTPGK